jgi:hypothetical protein
MSYPHIRAAGTAAGAATAAVAAIVLLTGCSKLGTSSSAASSSASGGATAPAACSLLTQNEVATATGASIQFSRQATVGSVSTCTFGSLSGFAVVLSVVNAPGADLSSDIPGLGNAVSSHNLSQVSGIGDQAYAGTNAIVARKGDTAFLIVYGSTSSGNHETALKSMAGEVVTRLP